MKRRHHGVKAMFWSDAIHSQQSKAATRPEDGRRHARKAYGGLIERMDGPRQQCGALDLSIGGVGILSSEPMEPGQVVHLAFLGRSVSVRGFVTHVRPTSSGDWRVGINFLQDEPELAEVALAAS
jgi:hypothetical protein